jgi:hypothetical protein
MLPALGEQRMMLVNAIHLVVDAGTSRTPARLAACGGFPGQLAQLVKRLVLLIWVAL